VSSLLVAIIGLAKNSQAGVVNLIIQNMNKFIEAAAIAISSILSHKLRAFLTLLGVIIGVFVVTLVATVIEGANVYIKEKIATLGTGVFRVQKASVTFGNFEQFQEAYRKNPDLKMDDLYALRETVTLAEQLGAQDGGSKPVKYGNNSVEGVGIQGVTPNLIYLSNVEVVQGRYISDVDEESRRSVAYIGAEVATKLFPSEDPVGKTIKIGNSEYTVIGVAKALGTVLGFSQDNFIHIPMSTYLKVFGSRRSLTFVIRARDGVPIAEVEDQVRLALRIRHKRDFNQPDDFAITSDETTEQSLGTITKTVASVAFPVVGISMVIGGIVIMNIMLATVTERTREIGIRKSLGATRRDILVQFLVESAMLSMMGGIAGFLLGVILMTAAARVLPIPVAIPLYAPILAIGVSTLTGIFFGLYPANRAAKLDPITALRAD
jgi:putative ABC transport system permease protein